MPGGELNSYKQLPASFYQIQTKFRDEIRPRFGVMRSREFIMKDAYSFHIDQESLQHTYDRMYACYNTIFSRIGLEFRPVLADTGSIGGSSSHEFHVLADSGEDAIAICPDSDYAANVELAEALPLGKEQPGDEAEQQLVATPGKNSIADVSAFLEIEESQILKTLIVLGEPENEDTPIPLLALVIRGDHELNEIKAEKLSGVASPLRFADDEQIEQIIGAKPGSIGPFDLPIKVIADRSAAAAINFTCGANQTGYHLTGANWGTQPETADIRNVVSGDPSPCGKGNLTIKRGIEVGHIFQLGTKYSDAMNASIQADTGKDASMIMGCYGIGVTRVVAAAIEQNHDENGIVWPDAIAPFQLAIVPINAHKSELVKDTCESIYSELSSRGVEVLLMDETKARLGVMLADIELIGIPHRIVVGERGLNNGEIEYRHRRASENESLDKANIVDEILKKLQ